MNVSEHKNMKWRARATSARPHHHGHRHEIAVQQAVAAADGDASTIDGRLGGAHPVKKGCVVPDAGVVHRDGRIQNLTKQKKRSTREEEQEELSL